MEPSTIAALVAAGLAAGFLSTLYGIGGGIVMVPVLHYGLGVPFTAATVISLAVIALQSPYGVYQHVRRGAVSAPIAIPLAVAGLLGVALGAFLQPHVPVPWLKLMLAGFMALAAYRLLARAVRPLAGQPPRISLALLGAGAGLVSRLLGVGGGLITVPALALMGVPMHTAVGSSLAPVFTNAAIAVAAALPASPNLAMAIPMALGAYVAVPLGARAAHALPDQALRRVFSAGMVAAALYVAVTAFG